jgi:hypothetical protein
MKGLKVIVKHHGNSGLLHIYNAEQYSEYIYTVVCKKYFEKVIGKKLRSNKSWTKKFFITGKEIK